MLVPLSLFFFWGILSSIIRSNLTTKDLIEHIGIVKQRQISKIISGRNNKSYPLLISFKDNNSIYRLPETYSNSINKLLQQVKPGDQVSIYTLSNWKSLLTWGKKNDIYTLKKNNKVLFGLEPIKNEVPTQLTYSFLFFVASLSLYFIMLKKQKQLTQK